MAKSKERNKAIELRQKGESIKKIAKRLKVAKSTVSLWCRDIKLTPEQIQKLHERMIKGSYIGRLKGAQIQYERRLKRIKELKKQGLDNLWKFPDRDFLIAGAALYWGEGGKKELRVTNSDPKIIKFMMRWFKKVWNIENKRFTLHIIINKIHKNRIKNVKEYWSKITKIPKDQFIKTTLIKAKNKRDYKNLPIYYGTLNIRIKKPTEIYHQIMGLIESLGQKVK